MNLTPEEREIGRNNYYEAVSGYHASSSDMSRRTFLQGVAAAGAVSAAGIGGMYFNYGKPTKPVRVGIIGTGDEGGVLIGALNPDYVDVVAIADIRPSSIHRALHGDWGGSDPAKTHSIRPGLMQKYGWKTEDEARKHVKVYEDGFQDLIKNDDVEAVIIALPLHLHAPATIAAMKAGKHVLTEKLMGHNIAQCKLMSRVAAETGLLLATGHQRHYSILYDNAVKLIKWGLLGQLHYIRAQWHRGNVPGNDSWAPPLPGGERIWQSDKIFDPIHEQLLELKKQAADKNTDAKQAVLLQKQIKQWEAWDADKTVKAQDHDYETLRNFYGSGLDRTALEELVRWRIWDRTGGGLMAELGSHQLDAASIFISALSAEKVHPLTVHAVGGRQIFPNDRDADDHVYCMFEFPAPEYDLQEFNPGYRDPVTRVPGKTIPGYDPQEHPQKKIVVTYSSINGNGFGGYGEVVMGTKGTLVLDREQEVMLYAGSSTSTKVGVKSGKSGPALDTQASGDGPAAKAAEQAGPVSRGYTEEIEHWAWCIRANDPAERPRCHPQVALGDAVIALTAKIAMSKSERGEGGYIAFDPNWFKIDHDAVPDDNTIEKEKTRLGLV